MPTLVGQSFLTTGSLHATYSGSKSSSSRVDSTPLDLSGSPGSSPKRPRSSLDRRNSGASGSDRGSPSSPGAPPGTTGFAPRLSGLAANGGAGAAAGVGARGVDPDHPDPAPTIAWEAGSGSGSARAQEVVGWSVEEVVAFVGSVDMCKEYAEVRPTARSCGNPTNIGITRERPGQQPRN